MKRSCENCNCFGETTRICHYTEDNDECIKNDYKFWMPKYGQLLNNYYTLERENAELTQALKRAWIKCSERLPEDDCTVFLANNDLRVIGFGHYSKNFKIVDHEVFPLPRIWESDQGLVIDCEITHWMKFWPKLPKETTQ